MSIISLISFLSAVLLCLLPSSGQAQDPVLASVKPLQLIASAVTAGVSEPGVLIPANQSPHHFSLKPSDVRRIVDADVIVWVGPGLETYLTSVLQEPGVQRKTLEMASIANVILLDSGELSHDPESIYDPHLWLDTRNALTLAAALASRLQQVDPANAARYQGNLERFESAVLALNEQLESRFADLGNTTFAVYHNGTQYFEQQMGLQHLFVLVPNHEVQPGVRHLLDLRAQVNSLRPVCLLEDINANAATVETVFRDAPLRRVRLDTLGEDITPSPESYVQLMLTIAEDIEQCLRP